MLMPFGLRMKILTHFLIGKNYRKFRKKRRETFYAFQTKILGK